MPQGNPGKIRLARLFCGLIALCATAPIAHADVLALYPFSSNSLASTDTNAQSTATAVSLGSGLTGATRFSTTGSPAPALRINTDETDGTTFATAITANDFFTFTLSPASGYRFVFQTLTVDLATNVTTFATNVRVQASVNGSAFINLGDVTTFSNTTFTTQTIDLSVGNGNAALAAGASVLLRIVAFDNDNNAANFTAFDNITVNGTLQAIPEPGTVALLTLGSAFAGTVILRRRKR